MEQVARNLLDVSDGFLSGKRYLILDRDPLYTGGFRAAMKRGAGGSAPIAAEQPEPECLRGEVRALDQKRVSGPDRPSGQGASTTVDFRVSCVTTALSGTIRGSRTT